MKQANKEKMTAQIFKHGEQLNAIFQTGKNPRILCSQLRRLEKQAHKLATDYCNGENGATTETIEILAAPIMAKLMKILFPKGMPTDQQLALSLFINYDCRGYALKIRSEYVKNNDLKIYTDWGGYGIIAPDFTPNN